MRGRRRYIYYGKDEIIRGLSPCVKCVAPLFIDISFVKVWSVGGGAPGRKEGIMRDLLKFSILAGSGRVEWDTKYEINLFLPHFSIFREGSPAACGQFFSLVDLTQTFLPIDLKRLSSSTILGRRKQACSSVLTRRIVWRRQIIFSYIFVWRNKNIFIHLPGPDVCQVR